MNVVLEARVAIPFMAHLLPKKDSDTDTDSDSCLLSFTEVAIRDSSPSLCNVNKLTVNGTKSSEALHLDLGVIHV